MRQAVYWIAPLVFLLASLALFAALLPACAARSVLGGFSPWECSRVEARPAQVALEVEADRTRVLEAEIRRLERELIASANNCPVQPRQSLPDPDEEATFDRDRWEERDITVLEGCWELESDYTVYNLRTQEPYPVKDWRICFDESGRGDQSLSISTSTRCSGRVTATFDEANKLTIADEADLPCQGQFGMLQRRLTTCTLGSDQRAVCSTRDLVNDGVAEVQLRRER